MVNSASSGGGNTTGTCVRAPGNGGRTNQGGMFFRTGTPGSNSTEVLNPITNPLPQNTCPQFVPVFSPKNVADPQAPCTIGSAIPDESACGTNYEMAYGNSGPAQSGKYQDEPISAFVTVSFEGTIPSSLGSKNWVAGGLSLTSPTGGCAPLIGCGGLDVGTEFYAYLDSSGNVGVAWYIIAACEFAPSCLTALVGYYKVLASGSATIPAKYATDQVHLNVYWNTKLSLFIFDWMDSNYSPYTWTVFDFRPPNYEAHYFYYGPDISCPSLLGNCNPPYSESFGYQIGFVSNARINNPDWVVEISSPGYIDSSGHLARYASTMGAQEGGTVTTEVCPLAFGDAWWHDNWVWGGGQNLCLGSYKAPQMTTVASAPIDMLSFGQANLQTFTAGAGLSTPETVTVTNFGALQSDAESAGEGNAPLGAFIWAHPFANGLWWTMHSSSATPDLTWTYAEAYQVPDNTAEW
ncbi:MAG: hypothetical protein ACRECH_07255 [Nitrososphaerales archaeon]